MNDVPGRMERDRVRFVMTGKEIEVNNLLPVCTELLYEWADISSATVIRINRHIF